MAAIKTVGCLRYAVIDDAQGSIGGVIQSKG